MLGTIPKAFGTQCNNNSYSNWTAVNSILIDFDSDKIMTQFQPFQWITPF
jgi:hypothetical protein